MIGGMLEMGKIKPERMNDGSMVKRMQSMKASCCDFVTVEIKSPIPSPLSRNTAETIKRKRRLPLRGTLKTEVPTRTTIEIWTTPSRK